MLTQLSDNLLKLEYNAGLQNLADELWRVATANAALHSVTAQKAEMNLNN